MKPGERQIVEGRVFKRDVGSSPNGVANAYLAAARGKDVVIEHNNECIMTGTLIAFDAYSLEIKPNGLVRTVLIFKGPGVVVSAP